MKTYGAYVILFLFSAMAYSLTLDHLRYLQVHANNLSQRIVLFRMSLNNTKYGHNRDNRNQKACIMALDA